MMLVKAYSTQQNQDQILPNDTFADLMADVIAKGKAFRFQAKGGSMSPFIKDKDIITVTPIQPGLIRKGDILAFLNSTQGKLNIHRVISHKKGKFLLKGDTAKYADGWIEPHQIIGAVQTVERNGKFIKIGLGLEKYIIAKLSMYNWLLPSIRFFWGIIPPGIKRLIK